MFTKFKLIKIIWVSAVFAFPLYDEVKFEAGSESASVRSLANTAIVLRIHRGTERSYGERQSACCR